MKKIYAVMGLAISLFSTQAIAAAKDVLQNRLAKVENFYAQFKQVTRSPEKEVIQEGQGELRLKRPVYFNWQLHQPEESSIISDGKTIWVYTPQVQQVTASNLKDVTDNTLLLLITDNSDQTWQKYNISRKQDTFSITPKEAEDKQHYEIGVLPTGMISDFTIIETDGQRSFYDLSQQSLAEQPQSAFQFEIPQGVTLDDQRQ